MARSSSQVLSLIALVVAAATLPSAQERSALSTTDLRQAIALGLTGNPAPYLLHHRAGPETANAVVVGVVYTPFLRVALAAHAADAAGATFTERDLTPDLVEPIVYIAFRWQGGIDPVQLPADAAALAAANYKIARRGDRVDRLTGGARIFPPQPLWTRADVSLLRKFGELPYQDLAVVAAYPAAVIAPNVSFAIFKEWPSTRVQGGMDAMIHQGLVTAADAAGWR